MKKLTEKEVTILMFVSGFLQGSENMPKRILEKTLELFERLIKESRM